MLIALAVVIVVVLLVVAAALVQRRRRRGGLKVARQAPGGEAAEGAGTDG